MKCSMLYGRDEMLYGIWEFLGIGAGWDLKGCSNCKGSMRGPFWSSYRDSV